MHLARLISPTAATRMCACGSSVAALAAFRLGAEAADITTPLLVTDSDRWPGQAQLLYDRVGGPKELVREQGVAREERIFSWLDRHLA